MTTRRATVDAEGARRAVRVAAAAQRPDRVRCMRTGGRHDDRRKAADRDGCRGRAADEETHGTDHD